MPFDDVLIVGSGIAALQLATHLRSDLNVRIITKSKLRTANSYIAQGGIAAAIGANDHPLKHFVDTLKAGGFYNNDETAFNIIAEAPALIQELIEQEPVFDVKPNGELALGMEGAHSEQRIVHSGGDATGKHVCELLIGRLPDHVVIEENVFAYELLVQENRCIGVKVKKADGKTELYMANHTVLATGGCGQLYRYTSNAETVTGDGIAIAYRAGAEIVDMEFTQFHPTLLSINGETKGLVSEAVRGEGAILVTDNGKAIMEGVHPLRDLAPRHIVSHKIFERINSGQRIFLDIQPIENFRERFPSITAICEKNGIDLSRGRIPVVPGCHFLMGGIKTDLIGRTSLDRLYAIGETGCTGFHGANRLASNSLLEGLYQGKKLANLLNTFSRDQPLNGACQLENPLKAMKRGKLPELDVLKDQMMKNVGIVRTKKGLEHQEKWLEQFKVNEIKSLDAYSIAEIEKIFMVTVAELITKSALKRTESRGGHYRSDYPRENDQKWLKRRMIYRKMAEERTDEQIEASFPS